MQDMKHHAQTQKVLSEGANSDKFVFCLFCFFQGERGSKNHHKRAIIDLPAKSFLNDVLLACR